MRTRHDLLVALIAGALTAGACRAREASIEPVYDPLTGKLQLLKSDSNGDGKIDTWSHMDGTRVLRIEIDSDEDGKVDRWEYYDEHQRLAKIGTSRANDGREDAWLYGAADGAVSRIEVSTRRDGKVNRVEFYEKDALVRAEEDSDADGGIDRWESYQAGRLAAVAFDSLHRGRPDRRFVYSADGSSHLEVDPDGSGQFVAVAAPQPRSPSR